MLQDYQLSPPPETERLLSGHPHQEVEVDVKVRPPGRPDPAPLLGGVVGALDPVQHSRHRPPGPAVVRVQGDEGPDIAPDTGLVLHHTSGDPSPGPTPLT